MMRTNLTLVAGGVFVLGLLIASSGWGACEAQFTQTDFSFDERTGLSTWDLAGQCEGNCCCDSWCPFANGLHTWWDDWPCRWYWTCENHASDYSQTCGRICSGYGVPNGTTVVVRAVMECGGYDRDSTEIVLGTVHFDWTPTISSLSVTARDGEPGQYDVSVGYEFPQSWQRSLKLYEINAAGEETDVEVLCYNNLGLDGTCYDTVPLSPDTVEVRVFAKACEDGSAVDEQIAYIGPPPPDFGPWGDPVLDDEPEQCEWNAEAGAPVRLTNGNMRYSESLPLPGTGGLAALTYDTVNESTGAFGKGWSSIFDARLEVDSQSTENRYRVVSGSNHSTGFSDAMAQTWPGSDQLGELSLVDVDGTQFYRHTEPSARMQRFYRLTDGRLGRVEYLGSGQVVTVDYDPGTGFPTRLSDEEGAWEWILTPDPGYPDRIGTITTADAAWSFSYDGDLLVAVSVDGQPWRTYDYDLGDRMIEVADGEGFLIESHAYDPATGRAITSRTADEHITDIEYEVPDEALNRPRNVNAGEYVSRVTWASGRTTDYYIRPVGAAPHRVAEIRGSCGCPGNGDFASFAHDYLGRVVRQQDAAGYITVREYDDQNRLAWIERGHRRDDCDPADHAEDPSACWLSADELDGAELSAEGLLSTTEYTYDVTWPNRPASVCRQSVVEPGEQTCDTFAYDPQTGVVVSSTREGYG